MTNPLFDLDSLGQSVWYDNISRDLVTEGGLARLVGDFGVRGVTSNPTIFAKAIETSALYDDVVRAHPGESAEVVFWDLARSDVQGAADILRPIYDEAHAGDGYVSLEVSPRLANDTAPTTSAAAENFAAVDRPNLMIKIPGTLAGLPAIEDSIASGINVNVTLLFAVERHMQAADAYIAGLERAAAAGRDLSRIASVASFFVSRVDTLVDSLLERDGSAAALALRGTAAVANAKLAYAAFQERFAGERWEALAAKGAQMQRPLWASTSTKNPAYSDVKYVEELVGPTTVNTMPQQTIDAFADHGKAVETITADVDGARDVMERLAAVGIDMVEVTEQLEEEGVAAFAKSFDELLATIEKKQAVLA